MSKTSDAFDRLGEGIFDLLTSFLTSRTTYIMALGFIAVYASSGKIEAFQQLLANLGLGALWVIKMATQNVVGIVKNGGAVNSTAVAVKSEASIPTPIFEPVVRDNLKFDTWDLNPPIPFDKEKFMAEIEKDVVGKYGEDNACTKFFIAQDKVKGVAAPWSFNNTKAWKDAWGFILSLAEDAFVEIWGVTYDTALKHINDDKGCTTCKIDKGCTFPDLDFKARYLGMPYYFILRQYREVGQIIAEEAEG